MPFPGPATIPGVVGLTISAAATGSLVLFPTASAVYPSSKSYPGTGVYPGVAPLTLTPIP